jgi:hypothetical protein
MPGNASNSRAESRSNCIDQPVSRPDVVGDAGTDLLLTRRRGRIAAPGALNSASADASVGCRFSVPRRAAGQLGQ